MIEREKGEGKGKTEVGVVLTEEVITTTKGVVSMVRIRDLQDMDITLAKEVKAIVTKARVTVIRVVVTANHPTNLPSPIIRTNNRGIASNTIIRIETRVELTVSMETMEVAIVVLGVDNLALSATGVMGFLIIYMEQAIGRPSALLNLSARSVVDLT